jgi:hypothetical protein
MSNRTTAERNAAKRARLAEAEAAAAAAAKPDFAVRTMEATEWRENERYPRFLLETCSAGSRLRVSRNLPNY